MSPAAVLAAVLVLAGATGAAAQDASGLVRVAAASEGAALLLKAYEGGFALGLAAPRAIVDGTRPLNLKLGGRIFATLKPGSDFVVTAPDGDLFLASPLLVATLGKALVAGQDLRFEYVDVVGAPHDVDVTLPDLSAIRVQLQLGADAPLVAFTVPPGTQAPPRISLAMRMGPPPALMERHARMTDCEARNSAALKALPDLTAQVSASAIAYALPCTARAGSAAYRLWVVEFGEIGGILPQFFAVPDARGGWRGTDLLPSVRFDGGRLVARETRSSPAICPYEITWRFAETGFIFDAGTPPTGCAAQPPAKMTVPAKSRR